MVYPAWYWFVVWIVSVACAVLCGWLAGQKVRSVFWYTLFGYSFFIITLIVVLVVPPKQTA
jgi:hypothetical protein